MDKSAKSYGKLLAYRKRHDTETSAELSIPSQGYDFTHQKRITAQRSAQVEAERDYRGARTLGIVALCFAIVSWFLWPVLLGATSAAIGYMAYRQGSGSLGVWAISLGFIAMVTHLAVIPLYFAFS
ncbi:hypothetical protein ACFOQM_18050 [Paenibacillus sp. GCM10012307]|uniref:hypothetical protein n=2 Tax=Paenibacillus TaxID=44249 RepID=UPI001E386BB7|nr:hypothetical protein [Paenibacillus roseus]